MSSLEMHLLPLLRLLRLRPLKALPESLLWYDQGLDSFIDENCNYFEGLEIFLSDLIVCSMVGFRF